ncbi:Uncharacterized conserved protein [Alteromonadaceae bacterium Bs31]|nr:Uncharacterized conserved protein [Alteromonadaceae bacterium Bs31]
MYVVDAVLIYHCRCKMIAITGLAEVNSPPPLQPPHRSISSLTISPQSQQTPCPVGYCTAKRFIDIFDIVVLLKDIKQNARLKAMVLLKQKQASRAATDYVRI